MHLWILVKFWEIFIKILYLLYLFIVIRLICIINHDIKRMIVNITWHCHFNCLFIRQFWNYIIYILFVKFFIIFWNSFLVLLKCLYFFLYLLYLLFFFFWHLRQSLLFFFTFWFLFYDFLFFIYYAYISLIM